MSRHLILGFAMALAAGPMLAIPARAQLQTMPMPPSASDPTPAEHAAPRQKTRKAAKPTRHAKRATAAGGNVGTPSTAAPVQDVERPSRQLEDDPHIAPEMSSSGHPGLGMKF